LEFSDNFLFYERDVSDMLVGV